MMRTSTHRPTIDPTLQPRLSIDVINGLGLSVAGVRLPLANRKARAMLAFLALESAQAVPRERLAAMFWSESSERHARNSLRQTLFELREALEARGSNVLLPGRDDVSLIRDGVDVDLDRVLDSIAAGQPPEMLSGAAGDTDLLLVGYDDLGPEFADWLTMTRRVTRTRLLRALECAYLEAGFPPENRRRLALLALHIEPLHEGACRAVMRLAAEAGEVGVALQVYAALYDAMGLQLDMEPSQATQALVADIKLGRLSTRLSAAPPQHDASMATQRTMLGRAPVVAVLPLLPVGSDEMTAWIAGAIVEDLVRVLAGLREPAVISSNSTRHLPTVGADLSSIGERLGAGYLLAGSVRMNGAFGRITVELFEARNAAVLWAGSYEITTSQIFEALEQIAASVANALGPRVNAAELRRSLGQPPDDLGGYHLLLRARELVFRMERETLEQAGQLIAEAIRRDPGQAGAHAARAYWYSLRIFQGWSPDPAADTASLMDAAHAAIRLDPHHARALALLGHNLMLAEHRYDEAEVLVDRAVAAAPNDAEVLITCSPTCAYVGRVEEAIRRAERALHLSPYDPFLFRYEHFCSIAHYTGSDFERAAYWGLRSWVGNPNFTSNLRITIAALAALGRIEEARPLVERHCALQPSFRAAGVIARNTFRELAQREQLSRLLSLAGLP